MKLSIVIVSYNVRYYLRQCLRSVFASRAEGGLEVFVVDNASSDHSISYLKPLFPQVHFIQNHENVGFSRANNQALRLAQGEYVLLLNPDTILTEHTLRDCLQFLDQHPDAGATGVAMYNHTGRFAWESRRGLPTPWTAFCRMSGLGTLFPHSKTFGHYYMRYLPRLEASRIEVISGAFCMIRHKALLQTGLLDEDFFMYGEDIDLSYRLLKAGWHNYYLPTPILHYKGESTQRSSYRYVHIFYEAMLIFFNKHYRRQYRHFALVLPLIVRTRAAIDLLQRYLKAKTTHKQTDPKPDMARYCLRPYPANTFAQMIEERIKAYEHGDRRSLGVQYTDSGLTILPHDVLTQ
ncbi:MAG: glycosyltransferase family 2 protein [Prevotellaceae bacterium]|nr:glycosyltransferase family 2 protein [Prevotellaceae bacterium]